jgi:hypothetical protein
MRCNESIGRTRKELSIPLAVAGGRPYPAVTNLLDFLEESLKLGLPQFLGDCRPALSLVMLVAETLANALGDFPALLTDWHGQSIS